MYTHCRVDHWRTLCRVKEIYNCNAFVKKKKKKKCLQLWCCFWIRVLLSASAWPYKQHHVLTRFWDVPRYCVKLLPFAHRNTWAPPPLQTHLIPLRSQLLPIIRKISAALFFALHKYFNTNNGRDEISTMLSIAHLHPRPAPAHKHTPISRAYWY